MQQINFTSQGRQLPTLYLDTHNNYGECSFRVYRSLITKSFLIC